MKKILLTTFLFASIVSFGQSIPRYSTFYGGYNYNDRVSIVGDIVIPAGGTPALGTGAWVRAGHLYIDTTGGNIGLHGYWDGVWHRFVDTTWSGLTLSGSNGLTKSGTTMQLFGKTTQKDTIKINNGAGYTFTFIDTSQSSLPNLTMDFTQSGNSNGNGVINLDAQTYGQIGYKYKGMDPGFVRIQVENKLTPTDVATYGGLYTDAGAGFSSRFNYSGMISQFFQAVKGNGFCDSCLMIRNNGAGIQFAADNSGYFWFRGSASNLTTVYGGFAAGGNFAVGNTAPISKVHITGALRVTDTATLFTRVGASTDSVLVKGASAGDVRAIAQTWTDSTYLPTLTSVANVASKSVPGGAFHYMKIGNQVTVDGVLSLTPTAGTTLTTLGISLPFASNLAVVQDLTGPMTASVSSYIAGIVYADATNDRAQIEFSSINTSAHNVYVHFMYTIK